jgi:hypothetical protein
VSPFLTVVLAALALGAGLAGASGLAGRGGTVRAWRIKSATRRHIERMLMRIAREDTPPVVMGAMCYDMALPIPVTEYLCPVCGGKTVYSVDPAAALATLAEVRTLFAALEGATDLEIRLDETSFCSSCRAGDGEPAPRVVVTYPDTVVSSPVTPDDLRLLAGFLSGDLSWSTVQDDRMPLRPHLDRIGEILGVEVP